MATVTPAAILRHTTSFLESLLSQPELRHRTLSSARLKLSAPLDAPLAQSLTLLSQSLETSPAAEKLLLSLPSAVPLSSLLLALSYAHRRRHVSASLALLDLFVIDPSFARCELAGAVFDNVFLPRLMTVVQWFSNKRSKIVLSGSSVLSRMSGGQAEELRELQRGYEEVMDENCRAYAEYLKKVLEGSEDVEQPELVFEWSSGGGAVVVVVEEEGRSVGAEDGQYDNVLIYFLVFDGF